MGMPSPAAIIRAVFFRVRFELFQGTDDGHFPFCVFPDRERACPEAVTGNSPIGRRLYIVLEAPFFKMRWKPRNLFVLREHLFLYRLNVYEPRRNGIVDERRATPV